MGDSASPEQAFGDVQAVAGYVDGLFQTYGVFKHRFGRLPVLSIAASWRTNAMVLDVEDGDATPANAADWVRRAHSDGYTLPALYTSLSELPSVIHALELVGVPRRAVRLWTAHWTKHPHLCSEAACGLAGEPPGATQYRPGRLGAPDLSFTSIEWVRAVIASHRVSSFR
jgi:hypothetical protein